ncbi:MAG: SH3 domain-containing protein [Chloroflexota bacterium]
MTTVLNLALPALAGLCLLGALILFGRGFQARGRSVHQTYGVGRQEARQSMQVEFVRGLGLLFVGLILLGIYGLDLSPADLLPTPTPTITPTVSPTATQPPATATPTRPAPTLQETITPPATPTNPLLAPTATATITPTETATSAPTTALVNSPNGLWLREAPGGVQEVELIPDGSVLTLLPGRETAADGLEWQQVRTPAGNEGWVAVDYIIYQ